jgi:membrane associated rhomboid family serine protease
VTTIVALLLVGGLGYSIMSPKERERLRRGAELCMLRLRDAAAARSPASAPLRDALRARTRRPLVTPALVVVNIAVFVLMICVPGALDDPDTLVRWGANFAPRTTNGEWWRLVTMMFVHSGPHHLLATIAGLVPLCLVLECLVGSVAFGTVFFAAGVLAGLVSLSTSAVAVSAGASGAIFGVYGLLSASIIWEAIANPHLPIPVATVNRIVAPAAVFVLYNVANDSVGALAEVTGFAAGFVGGIVLARGVIQYKPPARRSAVAFAGALVLACASALPLRGTGDVRGDIERVVALEARTATAYNAEVDLFKRGRASAASLARLIDEGIVPELQGARAHLEGIPRVPKEQQPLIAAAGEYFALRDKSWRMRADALRKASLPALREADTVERASLDAFQKIKDIKAPRTALNSP